MLMPLSETSFLQKGMYVDYTGDVMETEIYQDSRLAFRRGNQKSDRLIMINLQGKAYGNSFA